MPGNEKRAKLEVVEEGVRNPRDQAEFGWTTGCTELGSGIRAQTGAQRHAQRPSVSINQGFQRPAVWWPLDLFSPSGGSLLPVPSSPQSSSGSCIEANGHGHW